MLLATEPPMYSSPLATLLKDWLTPPAMPCNGLGLDGFCMCHAECLMQESSALLIVGQNDISNNHSAVLSISHSNMHSNASTFTLERISWVSFPSFSSSSLSIPCTGCLVPASLWHPRAILELKKRAHFCALKSENILKLQNGYRRKLFINVK